MVGGSQKSIPAPPKHPSPISHLLKWSPWAHSFEASRSLMSKCKSYSLTWLKWLHLLNELSLLKSCEWDKPGEFWQGRGRGSWRQRRSWQWLLLREAQLREGGTMLGVQIEQVQTRQNNLGHQFGDGRHQETPWLLSYNSPSCWASHSFFWQGGHPLLYVALAVGASCRNVPAQAPGEVTFSAGENFTIIVNIWTKGSNSLSFTIQGIK